MSQTTGKTSTYIKNANVKESTQIQTGFKNVRFLHQATAGDTLIQLTSLTTPTGAVNYSAPNVSDLTQTNLMQWPDNIRLTSSISGLLIQNISYVITGASKIKLLYSARDGEIFEGVINHNARTGMTLVDASPIIATGTLTAGSTDFNVGTPFQVGMYSSQQVGAVMVFVDKTLMTRNTGNNPPGSGVDGDYYEVHSGGGLGQIIRFNTPDLVNDRQVMVVSTIGLVERPNGSFMAVMESLQGQIDAMVPTLASLADVAETTFQGIPNNIDLKTFGDRVLQAEADINSLETNKQNNILTTWLKDVQPSGTAAEASSVGSYSTVRLNTQEGDNSFCSLSSNQFTLNPGTYHIYAYQQFTTGAIGANYAKIKLRNISDSSDTLNGMTAYDGNPSSSGDTVTAIVEGVVSLSSAKTFAIQQRSSATGSRGLPATFGDSEVYTVVRITKVG